MGCSKIDEEFLLNCLGKESKSVNQIIYENDFEIPYPRDSIAATFKELEKEGFVRSKFVKKNGIASIKYKRV